MRQAGLIAVATSTTRPVGIDIQHLSLDLDLARLSARFFQPDEAAYVAAGGDANAQADRFAHLWTRKEAVVKAAGGRLWPNLAVAVRDRAVISCAEPADQYRVADVAAPAGFRAAVALTGAAPFTVTVSDWPADVAESAVA
jgi:4'-phosphopantetheinyl transferase